MAVQLDKQQFERRVRLLTDALFSGVDSEQQQQQQLPLDAFIVPVGTSQDSYSKGISLQVRRRPVFKERQTTRRILPQTWLFGYEFPDTVVLLTKERKMLVLASTKKGMLLESLASPDFSIQAFKRTKDPEENAKANRNFLAQVEQQSVVGILPKDKFEGAFYAEYTAQYDTIKGKLNEVDVNAIVAAVLAVKDQVESKTMQSAAQVSSLVMSKYFAEEMASIVDEEKVITHGKFSERIENSLFDERIRKRIQLPTDIEADFLDWCYTPIVQSGGIYDLKPSAQSNTDNLHGGTILCALGVRYKNYCTNIGRTFMIDPSPAQEKNYKFLQSLQQVILDSMKDGVTCKDVWETAINHIRNERPELESHFVKNIGFVIGLEFRESSFLISGKNNRKLKEGMTVNLSIGFQDLENIDPEDERNRIYALLLSDTVSIGAYGGRLLTDAPKAFGEISFFLREDNATDTDAKGNRKSAAVSAAGGRSAVLKTKLRNENKDEEASAAQKRKQHQSQLMIQITQEALDRHSSGQGPSSVEKKAVFRKYESYKKDNLLPKEIRRCQILVDRRNETVLIPMFGYAVPFHINSIKNINKSEEGQYTSLRINFNFPGQPPTKKEDVLPWDDANANFVRSLTFRSTATQRYNELHKQINDLKKEVQKKEAERREKADLIEQDRLVESKRPLAVLNDVHIRPALEGKKLPGDLQIHMNGVRYAPIRGDQKVDILFSNVKHFFFQPCENELFVILHFHLKNPIMVGKKKTKDIQFVREATEASFDETSNRKRRQHYGDEDELMAEQEERRNRQRLNKEFKMFAERISEVSDGLEADVPIRELGFYGVPQRSNILMQPTTECLVHLSELPVTVITLADVEIVYLERVQFHLKNFDIVFVFKDLSRVPFHINSVPMKSLEAVREWLDSMDICFFETPVNLNWPNIIKSIQSDVVGFYEDGGWATMQESDNEDGSDEEDSASEYEMSSEDEESDVVSDSEFDEDESGEDSGELDESEEEGMDWDEMERKARRDDERRNVKGGKRRDGDSSDDDNQPRKKKR